MNILLLIAISDFMHTIDAINIACSCIKYVNNPD